MRDRITIQIRDSGILIINYYHSLRRDSFAPPFNINIDQLVSFLPNKTLRLIFNNNDESG